MPADMAALIKAAVDTGDYASTSEVVRDALRQWKMKRAASGHVMMVADRRAAVRRAFQGPGTLLVLVPAGRVAVAWGDARPYRHRGLDHGIPFQRARRRALCPVRSFSPAGHSCDHHR